MREQKSSLSHDADLLKCEIAVGKDFLENMKRMCHYDRKWKNHHKE